MGRKGGRAWISHKWSSRQERWKVVNAKKSWPEGMKRRGEVGREEIAPNGERGRYRVL